MVVYQCLSSVTTVSKCSSKGRSPGSSALSQHNFQFMAVDIIRNHTQLENSSDKKLNVLFSLIHESDCSSFNSKFLSERVWFGGFWFGFLFFFLSSPLGKSRIQHVSEERFFSSFYLVCSKKG